MHGVRLPIIELAERFALTSREVDLLFACLAVELDRRYERVYGFLHDDMSRRLASPGLAIGLHCESIDEQLSARALLNAQAPLRYYRLLEVMEDSAAMPWLSRSMRIDERIVSFLVGEHTLDTRIARHVTSARRGVASFDGGVPGRGHDESLERIVHFGQGVAGERTEAADLSAWRTSFGRRCFGARAPLGQLGMPVMTVDAELLVGFGDRFRTGPVLVVSRRAVEPDRHLPAQRRSGARAAARRVALSRAAAPCHGDGQHRVCLRRTAWCWQLPAEPVVLRIVELQPDGVAEQLHAWQAMSNDAFSDAELHHLVSLHPLPVTAIRDVWRMAQALVAANDDDATPTLEQVQQACRAFAGTPVSSLARRIEPKHRFTTWCCRAPSSNSCPRICSQAKHSSIVYGSWRFDRKLSLGRGLNAMFTGQPGTGKTMAAEVIAAELGVEILKIDLSQIVSKYIGETEKNLAPAVRPGGERERHPVLRRSRRAARQALRREGCARPLRQHRDRLSAAEDGGVSRASRSWRPICRQNMDAAFTRRMRFIVDFPFPEDEDRLRIWQSVWPSEVPLGPDVDLRVVGATVSPGRRQHSQRRPIGGLSRRGTEAAGVDAPSDARHQARAAEDGASGQ